MEVLKKKIHGSGVKLIIEEEDKNDIIEIIEALENSGILLQRVTKTIDNETKEQRGGFLSMLLGTLGASLLGNLLAGKGMMRGGKGQYYINEPRFNGVYSGNNLPKKIKKGAYVINLDEYENTGTHWIALFVKTNEAIYFDSFGIERLPNEINEFIGNENIKSNIFRLQACDSIMRGYYCIEFINYMLKGKTLLDYTNLFSANDFKKNDQVIKKIFKK